MNGHPGNRETAIGSPRLGAEGLILDWGGVLTTNLHFAMHAWADGEKLDLVDFGELMQEWLGGAAQVEAFVNPVHALERGEMEVPDFERRLAQGLAERAGRPVAADGLVERIFVHLRKAHDMTGLVRRAHEAGIRTALLSNSWGNEYPEHIFDGMFDVVVISGQVGMRKPEERIYRHTVEQLELAATDCVFVDDMAHNVDAAVGLGMIGVHHVDYDQTANELELIFGVPLRC